MYIAIRVIMFFVLDVFIALSVSYFYPKFKKREDAAEAVNASQKTVKMEWSKTLPFMLPFAVIVNLAGIVIMIIPNLIDKWLGNVWTVAVIWYAVMLVDDIILYFMFVTAHYDDEKITVKKPFCKAITYRFDEIVDFTTTGNLTVETKTGKFTLFNAMSGTKTLRDVLIKKRTEKTENEVQ